MPHVVAADIDMTSLHLLFVHADRLDQPLKMTDGSQVPRRFMQALLQGLLR